MRLAGNWTACNSHYFLGNFVQSIRHADVILDRYDDDRDSHVANLINHDPKTIALAYKAASEWRLGFPDRALATADAAISNARRRRHFFDLCWVHAFLGFSVLNHLGDTARLAISVEESERLAVDQQLLFFSHVFCPISRAFWLLASGRVDESQV